MNNTASQLYLHILFQTLKRHGVDKQFFLDYCDRDSSAITDKKARLPIGDVLFYWGKAAELTQCNSLGLEAGIHLHPSDYGIMSHVWMNCKNLREAAQLTIHYKHLMNKAFHSEFHSLGNGDSAFYLDFSNGPLQESSALVELDFASILHLGHFLTERSHKHKVLFKEVHFKHQPNAPLAFYEETFACPVKFEQTRNKVVCRDEVMDLPIHAPNSDLRDIMLKIVDKLVTKELGTSQLANSVSSYIGKKLSLGRGIPEAETIAKHFGYSLSTFKRHLQSEGTTYLALYNQVRKEIAEQMLQQKDNSLSEITYVLGFANSSAFHRAFKRWFDQTPKQYRAQYIKDN
mgnify:CR=1 FL=1